jgi:hypothetical protein
MGAGGRPGSLSTEERNMSETQTIEGIRVERDPVEPDWRYRLLEHEALVGEVYFDADTGWDVGDRPRGWTLRYVEAGLPAEFCREEEIIPPSGKPLSWGAGEVAAAAAVHMVAAARAA